MKKNHFLFALLFLASIIYLPSCSQNQEEQGVLINGVRWATRNVDAPGTFAKNPEDTGMLFQWNRRKGWSATEPGWEEPIDNWNRFVPAGSDWIDTNCPCPKGWRLPTSEEFQSLIRATNTLTEYNGELGRLFGLPPNQIFLPYVGWRFGHDGSLAGVGPLGNYWSSTSNDSNNAVRLALYHDDDMMIGESAVWIGEYKRTAGLSVRCVKNEEVSVAQQTTADTASEQGVPINGVRWATSNVDTPGTFAANPEDAGMIFQWNDRRGWGVTRGEIGWDWTFYNRESRSDIWVEPNDPCPAGWRIPAPAEWQSLISSGSVWTTRNGVNGRLFGTAPNQIFLPAMGGRDDYEGVLIEVGVSGNYWSNRQRDFLFFANDDIDIEEADFTEGFFIRCVKE